MLIALVFTYCANENTKMSIKLAEKSNERLQKLFEAQVRPLVQSAPIDEQFVLKKGVLQTLNGMRRQHST